MANHDLKVNSLELITRWDPDWRTALFIDGANLYAVMHALGFDIDFARLLEFFRKYCDLTEALYYTAVREDSNIIQLIDFLEHNGYTVVQKPARDYFINGERKTKGNMDIEMAVDMLQLATCRNPIEHAILFTGDGDFAYAVEALKKQGVRVTVVSTILTAPPMVATLLRKKSNEFLELKHLREELRKFT